MENNRLTGQFSVIVFGEGDVNVLLFAGSHTNNLLFKTGNKGTGTQLQIKVVALAALERNTVIKALEINVGSIAHFSSALNSFSRSNILCHTIQLSLYLLVGNNSFSLLNFQALVGTQGHFGINLSGQGQSYNTLIRNLHISQVGTAYSLQILLNNSFFINLREDLFQAVFIENVCAIHRFDHLPGSLALTEAGNHNILAGLQVCLVYTLLHQFLIDFYNDSSLIAVFLDVLYVHCYPPKMESQSDSSIYILASETF